MTAAKSRSIAFYFIIGLLSGKGLKGGLKMLENISPERVFHYFEAISAIPRGSGNTKAVSEFCVSFAKEHSLEYKRDAIGNVIIKKPAALKYEDHPPVILQGHLDMVCEKAKGVTHDFEKDGLTLRVDGDLISAEGTTLGADDGIAVAMILAVLEDKELLSPAITALFTVDEETGMYGAQEVDPKDLGAAVLINIDSEGEGVLTVGCAGGAKVNIDLPLNTAVNSKPCKKIVLSGLLGGHSGIDINKGRQNADIMLARFISSIGDVKIVGFIGGFKDNVIPSSAECVIVDENNCNIQALANAFVVKNRADTDQGLSISVEDAEEAVTCFDAKSSKCLLNYILSIPSGVVAMDKNLPELVESSMNLGVVFATAADGIMKTVISVRSSVAAKKQEMLDGLKCIAARYGAGFSVHGHYPAWEFRKESRLRDVMVSVYEELYGKRPTVETVHAGLECGLFCEKIPDFDGVSIGPDMWDIHTANERLSISSVKRTYDYLCAILKEL